MSGYAISLEEFSQLLTDPHYKKAVAPVVEKWFDGKLIMVDGELNLRISTGEVLSLSALHTAIQADAHKQYTLYQQAMSLWR